MDLGLENKEANQDVLDKYFKSTSDYAGKIVRWQKEVGDVEFIKFENVGDSIECAYLDLEVHGTGDERSCVATVDLLGIKDNSKRKFFCPFILESKLSGLSKGSIVRIVYKGKHPHKNDSKKSYHDYGVYVGEINA